jgi:hypothetical protein
MNSPATQLLTELVDCGPTNRNGIPIEVIHVAQRQISFAVPDADGDSIPDSNVTITNMHITEPNTAVSDNGGVHDISARTDSKDESHIHISCHPEDHKVENNIGGTNQDMAGSSKIFKDNADGPVIGHPVQEVNEGTGGSIHGSCVITQSSTSLPLPLDEDVRVLVPSTPE